MWMLGMPLPWTFEAVLSEAVDVYVHLFVADVTKSFDTVDRVILDCALGRLCLPDWSRKVYFSCHAKVRLRFKLGAGLWEAWTEASLKDAP